MIPSTTPQSFCFVRRLADAVGERDREEEGREEQKEKEEVQLNIMMMMMMMMMMRRRRRRRKKKKRRKRREERRRSYVMLYSCVQLPSLHRGCLSVSSSCAFCLLLFSSLPSLSFLPHHPHQVLAAPVRVLSPDPLVSIVTAISPSGTVRMIDVVDDVVDDIVDDVVDDVSL